MCKFLKSGRRVFDTSCGESGTVISTRPDGTAKIAYDQYYGCTSNIDYAPISDLEPIIEVLFQSGPSRYKDPVQNENGELESPGVDFMQAVVEIDGKNIELYAECGETDIDGNNTERFWITDKCGNREWDWYSFNREAYLFLRQEILSQAEKANIPSHWLKFWWD